MIFLLTTFSAVEQHFAQGANLIFFIPTCIISIFINTKNKNIDYKVAMPIIIIGIIGSIIGSKLSVNMSIKNLKRLFGLFLILISFYEIYSLKKEYINRKNTNNKNIKKFGRKK